MKKITLFLLMILFAACQPESKPESVPAPKLQITTIDTSGLEKDLKQAYDVYKTAVLNGNGAEAASLVSSKTIGYYSSLLDLVLTADSNRLVLASLLEKFTVLAIRQTVDWGRLRAMDGKQLFIYAIENGMIGKDVVKTSIGVAEKKSNSFALGQLLHDGKPTRMNMEFYLEEGKWRVDLVAILKENENSLKKMMGQSNLNETQSLLLFLTKTFGVEPKHEIWLPVKWYNK